MIRGRITLQEWKNLFVPGVYTKLMQSPLVFDLIE